jgi:GAF domain-containing protein
MRGFMTPFLTIDIANRKRAWSGARQWLVGAVATMAAIALAACGGWRWWQ